MNFSFNIRIRVRVRADRLQPLALRLAVHSMSLIESGFPGEAGRSRDG